MSGMRPNATPERKQTHIHCTNCTPKIPGCGAAPPEEEGRIVLLKKHPSSIRLGLQLWHGACVGIWHRSVAPVLGTHLFVASFAQSPSQSHLSRLKVGYGMGEWVGCVLSIGWEILVFSP
jgi:hypothetical protein